MVTTSRRAGAIARQPNSLTTRLEDRVSYTG